MQDARAWHFPSWSIFWLRLRFEGRATRLRVDFPSRVDGTTPALPVVGGQPRDEDSAVRRSSWTSISN